MSSLCGVAVFKDYVRGCVVYPLHVYIVAHFAIVVVYECQDVVGVHVVDAADVDLVPLRFEGGVFGVDRWDEG